MNKLNIFKKTWLIIIHHSAFKSTWDFKKDLELINKSHKKRFYDAYINEWKEQLKWYKWTEYIAYHFVIWKNWEFINTKPLNYIWYHAWN